MSPGRRLASLFRRAEHRVANPVVARVLRSRRHRLLSGRFLLLSYEGRVSGRRFTTPVLYRTVDDGVVLFTPAAKTTWWKNFQGGHPCRVLVRGTWRPGWGEARVDDAARSQLRAATGGMRTRSRRLTGREFPSDARLREVTAELAVVHVRFGAGTEQV